MASELIWQRFEEEIQSDEIIYIQEWLCQEGGGSSDVPKEEAAIRPAC